MTSNSDLYSVRSLAMEQMRASLGMLVSGNQGLNGRLASVLSASSIVAAGLGLLISSKALGDPIGAKTIAGLATIFFLLVPQIAAAMYSWWPVPIILPGPSTDGDLDKVNNNPPEVVSEGIMRSLKKSIDRAVAANQRKAQALRVAAGCSLLQAVIATAIIAFNAWGLVN